MRTLMIVLIAGLCCASCAHSPPAAVATTQALASPRDVPGLPNFAQVSSALYRGAQPDSRGFQKLKEMGVKTIVDLRGQSHRDEVEALGLKYVHIPTDVLHIEDAKVLEFLRVVNDPANQPVFVHCSRGADRTGCYVAAYRMVEEGWSEQDAEAELPRFHFFPLWCDIPAYLRQLDVRQARARLLRPATAP